MVEAWSKGARPERQLYIHVPFCPAFCHFCILYKTMDPKQQGDDYREAFVAALLREIEAYGAVPATSRQPCAAVYFGGGTPSMLTSDQVNRIMNAIRRHIPLTPNVEVTFEGMPHQLKDPDYLRNLCENGVTRISYGVQSFQPELRKQLGRVDTVRDIFECAENVTLSGIPELNIELLFGIPGMSMSILEDELKHAIRLNPATLDLLYYNATPGTAYYDMMKTGARGPQVAGDELLSMRRTSMEYLESSGFQHTSGEIFDRRNRVERFHEIHFGGSFGMDEIIGLGPSSYGFLDGVVYQNVPSVSKYIELINSGHFPLRTQDAIRPDAARRRGLLFGLLLFRVPKVMVGTLMQKMLFRRWERRGLVKSIGPYWHVTREGRVWYNLMQLELLSFDEGRAAFDLLLDGGEQRRLLFNPSEAVGNVTLVRELEKFIEGPVPVLRSARRYLFQRVKRREWQRGRTGRSKELMVVIEKGQNAFTGY